MEIDEKLKTELRQWLWTDINDNCIYRVPFGAEELPAKMPGHTYIWQFYPRRGLFNAKFMNAVGVLFWDMFAEDYKRSPFQLAGLETGSTPLLCAITMTAPLYGIDVNTISIRASRKKYGLKNRFEGIINRDLPVLLVDDMVNSRNAIAWAKYYCELEGLKIYNNAFAVLNKDIEGAGTESDKYLGDEIKIKYIFKVTEFFLDWAAYDFWCKVNNRPKVEWQLEQVTTDPISYEYQ